MPDHPPALRLTVHTDYKSPYAYVADGAIRALAAEYPISIDWKPYTLRIAEYLDPVDTRSQHNWRKVKYAYMDARRLANRHGLVLKGPKRIYNGELASLGMLFAQRNGFFDTYHRSTFERFWRHDLDLDSTEEMQAHIAALGGSADAFLAYANGPGRDEHADIVREAEAAGVFGVPMMLFDGQLHWGGDRLWMVREAIEAALAARAAAQRTGSEKAR
jgi:2-hydroxychromene-2-carboxylate isomerase